MAKEPFAMETRQYQQRHWLMLMCVFFEMGDPQNLKLQFIKWSNGPRLDDLGVPMGTAIFGNLLLGFLVDIGNHYRNP